jgi:hypothetical protein
MDTELIEAIQRLRLQVDRHEIVEKLGIYKTNAHHDIVAGIVKYIYKELSFLITAYTLPEKKLNDILANIDEALDLILYSLSDDQYIILIEDVFSIIAYLREESLVNELYESVGNVDRFTKLFYRHDHNN